MNSTIPEALTPDDLRKEATRRELRDQHRGITERRAARNVVVDAILAIDGAAVMKSGADEALKMAINMLARADEADQEKAPTNGDISMAGRGDWWSKVIEQTPHVETHPMLQKNRRSGPVWRG